MSALATMLNEAGGAQRRLQAVDAVAGAAAVQVHRHLAGMQPDTGLSIREAAFREMYRVTKPGGHLLAADVDKARRPLPLVRYILAARPAGASR